MRSGATGEQSEAGLVSNSNAAGAASTPEVQPTRPRRRRFPQPIEGPAEPPRPGVAAFLRKLGPGLITGAADDDPSGIATYSQAGAAFGFGLLWMALVSFPLMVGVQYMCARIGLVARQGLAAALREHYARWVLWLACVLLIVANTLNIAADLSGMAAAATLLTGIPQVAFVPAFALLILGLLILTSYDSMTKVLKWLALVLFAYVIAGFLARPSWLSVLRGTLVPAVQWDRDYLLMVVAILGTTISPYLFFWQASQTAEQSAHIMAHFPQRRRETDRRELRRELLDAEVDTNTGMFMSQLIMYFIVLTAGATLHVHGVTDVQTAAQAAQALLPLAGPLAYWLFALGIIGVGMLGVPVLAGSAAYAVAEAGRFPGGMDEKPRSAREFYGVMSVAMLVGMFLALAHLNAIKMLLWSAVVNGVLAPPLVVIILLVCNNERIMGHYRNGRLLNVLGWITAVLMGGAAVAMIVSFF